ncbi:MAG: hypothetical protein ACTSQJ_17790 [Promethearchaeota archaeon]
MLLQIRMRLFPEFILLFIIPIFFAMCLIYLYIGLRIAKAEQNKAIQWCLLSMGALIAVGFFLSIPFILLGFSGAFSDGPPPGWMIAISIIVLIFVEMNVLNAMHKIGLFRAFIVLIFLSLPVFLSFLLASILPPMSISSYLVLIIILTLSIPIGTIIMSKYAIDRKINKKRVFFSLIILILPVLIMSWILSIIVHAGAFGNGGG